MQKYKGRWNTVLVELDAGIAWVTLNRPAKRNAMMPAHRKAIVVQTSVVSKYLTRCKS